MKLHQDQTALLIIDVQERLAPAMEEGRRQTLLKNLERLGAARQVIKLPTVITEQYPMGLGPTLAPVLAAFEGVKALDKVTFSACEDAAIAKAIQRTGATDIIIAGMETHICVYQTARDLAERYKVHILADAVASRTQENYEIGLGLARAAGCLVSSTEAVLFDLLGQAGTDAFKVVSKLVR